MYFWIIAIVLLILAAIITFKVVKTVVKTMMILSFIVIAFFVISGLLITLDANEFKDSFLKRSSTYLLEDNGEIEAGLEGMLKEGSEPSFIGKEKLKKINTYYPEDKDSILGDSYKVFIFKKDAFEDMGKIDLGGEKYPGNEVLDMLFSKDPARAYLEIQGYNIQQKDMLYEQMQIEDDAQFKGLLFASLFGTKMADDPLFLVKSIKKDNLEVYKKTMLFKAMDLIPSFIFEKVLGVENESDR